MMLTQYVAEQVTEGLLELAKVDTADNVADVLTKIMVGSPYTVKADQLLGIRPLDLSEISAHAEDNIS